MFRARFILPALLAFPSVLAAADIHPAPPLASVPHFTQDEGWALLVGFGAEYEVEYDGADSSSVEAEPLVVAHWRSGNTLLFWEGLEAGARWFATPQTMLQLGARYEQGREEDDSDDLEGLGDVDSEFFGVAEARYGFNEDWSWFLAARAMVGPSSQGSLGVLALGKALGKALDLGPRWKADVLLFNTFATDKFIAKDFGITPQQAAATDYEVFEPDGGYRSTGLQFTAQRSFGRRWLLLFETGYERYGSEVRRSPLVQRGSDDEAEVGVAVAWRFGT